MIFTKYLICKNQYDYLYEYILYTNFSLIMISALHRLILQNNHFILYYEYSI